MTRRRLLSGIHTTMARHAAQGVTPPPLVASRDVAQLTPPQLDAAGAGLLPTRAVCPDCDGRGDIERLVTDDITTWQPCAECDGRGYYTEEEAS